MFKHLVHKEALMSSTALTGDNLKRYRKQLSVTQSELAIELGYRYASAVCRLEKHAVLTRVQFANAVAAIERVAERKANRIDPLAILQAEEQAS